MSIGPYTVDREIGRGGMGVVYLGRDTSLDRTVAIKGLPADFAEDAERLARFEREAKTLAQLNHANIAAIYAIEEHEGSTYLVLEYVEGETLAERLDAGPLPVDEALEFCIQIAAGVEAAHDAAVVHRDIKPANIKITPDGRVKVLDFGLAKCDERSTVSLTDSPTKISPIEHSPTIPGAIMGTPPYMSPEQARGRTVDKRTDIWSFGVVLYECLTGVGPFRGETATDCIGAILHKDADMSLLPADAPPMVRHVIERCLQRDRKLRLRDIGDARQELELARTAIDAGWSAAPAKSRRVRVATLSLGAVIALAAVTGAVMIVTAGKRMPPRRLVTDIVPPVGLSVSYRSGPVALSPDGNRLAFVAIETGDAGDTNDMVLCVRDLRTGDVQRLAESETIKCPFWSPDGRSLGYFADNQIWTIEIDGGAPVLITSRSIAPLPVGAHWTSDGMIFHGGFLRRQMERVDPLTGQSDAVMDTFSDRGGDWPIFPQLLPDGEHVLFTSQDDEANGTGVYVGSLSSGLSIKCLLPFETNAVYVDPPGVIVYWRGGSLHAQSFDLEALELTGEPRRIADDVWWSTWPTHAAFSVSADGRLAYLPAKPATAAESELVLLDRATGALTVTETRGSLWSPRWSHDGRHIAIDRTTDRTAGDIVVLDIERRSELMVAHDDSNESVPIWSHDDSHVYFFRGTDIYSASSIGGGAPTLVYSSPYSKEPCDVTPDGRSLLFHETRDGIIDLCVLDLQSGKANVWKSGIVSDAALSPSGEWIVYRTASQLVLSDFPEGSRHFVVTSEQGFGDVYWAKDSSEIVVRTSRGLYSVSIDLDAQPNPTLGQATLIAPLEDNRGVAASPDLQQFIFIRVLREQPGTSIRLIDNWWDEDEG